MKRSGIPLPGHSVIVRDGGSCETPRALAREFTRTSSIAASGEMPPPVRDPCGTGSTLDVETPHGPARAHLHRPAESRAALLLGHGAGGTVNAPDLTATTGAALEEGIAVALVEQPYRVAGRKSSPAAKQLDAAWLAVVEHLRVHELAGLPLIAGGRSAGARVACRTATDANASGVLCLAFPLRPPRRKTATEDPPSRQPELDAVAVPMLIVQGERDRFGMPEPGPRREIGRVPGDHSLRQDPAAVAAAVRDWLRAF